MDETQQTQTTFKAKRDEQGRFLEKPAALAQYTITRENAADMARRRWEKYREAAADAVSKEMGSIVPGITTPEAAWGVLNARLATQIMDSDKPRGDDLQALGKNMGAIPSVSERTDAENPPPQDTVGILNAAAALFRLMADTPGRAPEIVDGTVTDTRKD